MRVADGTCRFYFDVRYDGKVSADTDGAELPACDPHPSSLTDSGTTSPSFGLLCKDAIQSRTWEAVVSSRYFLDNADSCVAMAENAKTDAGRNRLQRMEASWRQLAKANDGARRPCVSRRCRGREEQSTAHLIFHRRCSSCHSPMAFFSDDGHRACLPPSRPCYVNPGRDWRHIRGGLGMSRPRKGPGSLDGEAGFFALLIPPSASHRRCRLDLSDDSCQAPTQSPSHQQSEDRDAYPARRELNVSVRRVLPPPFGSSVTQSSQGSPVQKCSP
jgi:hypothetical protein